MCRFYLIQSNTPINPGLYLPQIAETIQANTALDGSPQADGWGIAYLDSHHVWQIEKSPKPIWDDETRFSIYPSSHRFVIHARSTDQQVFKLAHNQPYKLQWKNKQTGLQQEAVFCCNLALKGMKRRQIEKKIGQRLTGEIGAQKVASLIRHFLACGKTKEVALLDVVHLIQQYGSDIQVANMGLMDKTGLAAACLYGVPSPQSSRYAQNHYRLQHYRDDSVQMIGSNQFGQLIWQPAFENGEIRSVTR